MENGVVMTGSVLQAAQQSSTRNAGESYDIQTA